MGLIYTEVEKKTRVNFSSDFRAIYKIVGMNVSTIERLVRCLRDTDRGLGVYA